MTAGHRDQQQAADFVRAVWWAGAVKAPTGRAADDLVALLAAARADGDQLRQRIGSALEAYQESDRRYCDAGELAADLRDALDAE